ncbi:MAG: hypothetical protein COX19_08695 [Desulfobacterales bacterium CG23_combo_of_CG06-09_8_20_14_all_51_8]|nr:MAG: hypothetical protein COX19_08695 [Desulfobacterales bacterium CG23_combo_of_CG06-09_8_20_14_all_51_8]
MNPEILIIAEQIRDDIAPVTYELVAAAKSLRKFTGGDIIILMTGGKNALAPVLLAEKTGLDILTITCGSQNMANEILLKNLPDALLSDLHPAWICMAQTSRGLDAAPALAVKLNAACITGVEKISFTDDGICFTRAVFNDKISARVKATSRTTVLTVAPGAFKPEPDADATAGKISFFDLPGVFDAYEWLGEKSGAEDTSALDSAEVIVSAGNGVRKKEDLGLMDQLAALFPKSAVTGSRPLCDKKWLPYNRQVGITGATVAPKVYIACGISGSSQHISGMRDAKFIVSINTDPHAAIFNISDICIIEDLTVFIPELITACREYRNRRLS